MHALTHLHTQHVRINTQGKTTLLFELIIHDICMKVVDSVVRAGRGNHNYKYYNCFWNIRKDNTITRNGANGLSVAVGDGYM